MSDSNKSRVGTLIIEPLLQLIIIALPQIALWPGNVMSVSDFAEYYASAVDFLSGNAALTYNVQHSTALQHSLFPEMKDRFVPFPYLPVCLYLFAPLGWLEPLPALFAWTATLILFSFLAFTLLKATFDLPRKWVLRSLAVFCCLGPLWESVRIGKPTPFLLAGYLGCMYFLTNKRFALAAISLVLLFLKPDLALVVLMWLAGGVRLRVLALFALACSLIFSASLFYPGFHAYLEWLNLARQAADNDHWMGFAAQPNLRSQLMRIPFLTFAQTKVISTMGLAFLQMALCFVAFKLRNHRSFIEVGLLLCLPFSLFFSLHCHNYDLLLLLPSMFCYVTICRRLGASPREYWALAVVVLPLVMPFYNWLHYYWLLKGGAINFVFVSLLVYLVLIVRLALKVVREEAGKPESV